MAAAGPRGRDGPSPREFTAVRHFMMADLGLSGLPLLVYARIFGFCDGGCDYFESKGNLARFLNVQERSAHRAIRDLLDRGCVPSSKNRQIRLSNFDTLMLTASGRAGAEAGPPAA